MSLAYGFTLQPTDDSQAFSNALHAVAGDGVTLQGRRLSLTVNGLTVTLGPGYALAGGRWVKNDEALDLPVSPASNNRDRVDALAARVDYEARKAALEVIENVDPAKIRENPAIMRDDGQYVVFLYFIRIRRGAVSLTLDDVTDLREDSELCGGVVPLVKIAGDVIYVYQFLNGGIDAEVARLIGLSNLVIAKAEAAIVELNKVIQQAGGGAGIGELMTSRHPPSETGWLVCDGSAVPDGYGKLSALLGGSLPDIPGERYKTYIFGGAPGSTVDPVSQ